MRNQSQSSMAELLDLQDELNQHLAQAGAVIDYLCVDISQNDEFLVSTDVLRNMLWTAQTLIDNAEKVSDKISEWRKQGGKQ